ncbi:MAG: tryptophan synthase subunit alpha [Betaproteobacteria bacterium]|nr:tryptophan synthase subunit alpha [Betaproteobacteria bacterium]
MSRIPDTFARLKADGRKALIPFVTAGDPDRESTIAIMHALVAGGADVIELGVPFSDPMADGPTIQRASERALRNGTSLRDVLALVRTFREQDQRTPVVLMGYANPVEAMGYDTFVDEAARAGVDGVLVVDYPPEESADLTHRLRARGIDSIFLLSPTSDDARMADVGKLASGYVYYVSLKGVTGAAHIDLDEVGAMIPRIRAHVDVPIGVGFGIRDGETARAIGAIADAVVIGSRLVQEIEASTPETAAARLGALVESIRKAMDA